MGGLAVDKNHKTSVDHLYAVGECASMYHGANRLGGNSLLAAIYSGHVAANAINTLAETKDCPNFEAYISEQEQVLEKRLQSKSRFSAVHVRHEIAKLLNDCLGITRTEEKLLHQYNSHNTERLDIEGTKAKMMTTDYIKEELAKLER